jgi:hypothetical protein
MPKADAQMLLFKRLPIPKDAVQQHRRRVVAACVLAIDPWPQLAFVFRLRELERDIDDAFDFPQHRALAAADAPAPETRAPASIFELAAMVKASGLRARGRFGGPSPDAPAKRLTVQRADGVVKVVGAAYPANRWDEERFEQERLRRARQKPPKPTRKAKTRSKKLLELIGDTDD